MYKTCEEIEKDVLRRLYKGTTNVDVEEYLAVVQAIQLTYNETIKNILETLESRK